MKHLRSLVTLPRHPRWLRAQSPVVGLVVSAGLVLLAAPAARAQVTTPRVVSTQAQPTFVVERSDRGWMGISINIRVTSDGTRPGETVIQVVRTVDGSAASRAGIVPGDVIQRINREPLTLPGWERLVGNLAVGDEVHLGVRGDDDHVRDVMLTAGTRPDFTPVPSELSDRLEAVRESFEARLQSARGVWASRDHVRLLISGDSIEATSNRILDQARRNAVAFGFSARSGETPSDVTFRRLPEPPVEGGISFSQGPGGFVWSFGGDSVRGWSSSGPVLVAPNVEARGQYSVVLSAQSALPFEYLLLTSPEADSLKTVVIRLRTELHSLNEATRTRELEIVEIVRRQARELGETDFRLNRLRSDNDRVSEELSQVAARLAEVGSLERRERAAGIASSAPVVRSRHVTARLVGRNFVGGAQLSDLNPRLSAYFGAERGVLVIDVLRGTPAFNAGLVPGDVVVRVGSTEIDGLTAFRRVLNAVYGRERNAVLSLIRKGEPVLATLSR